MRKKVFSIMMAMCMALSFMACGSNGEDKPQEENTKTFVDIYEGIELQGVTEEKIFIGNTAAVSGEFATVGTAFNIGLNAALKAYNDKGGFGGKIVELVHYDDGFDAKLGLTYTKKLVEEDKVFALVGHFGTPTVDATLDYISTVSGIPMVYAASGILGLYKEKAEGMEQAIMPVQPIYNTEGRVLLARAVAGTDNNTGLGGKKIGVISTKDEAGTGILEGIKGQAKEFEDIKIKYVTTDAVLGTNHASAVNTLKEENCDVIIIAANKAPFGEIMNYMRDCGLDHVKVITSYASADAAFLKLLAENGAITETREVYTTTWIDIASAEYIYKPGADNPVGSYLLACYQSLDDSLNLPTQYDAGVFGCSEEYWAAAEAICAYDLAVNGITSATAFTNSYNSYALAGYIAGSIFIEGLKRIEKAGKELTWANYIMAMESEPIEIPMGGIINLAKGSRLGVSDMALTKYDLTDARLVKCSDIISLENVIKTMK